MTTLVRRAARWMAGLLASAILPQALAASACQSPAWPLWQTFHEHFVQADGRVLDASTPQQHSSSEGQSYAMFFALVANDQSAFDALWRWTQNNLIQGNAATRLPGWFWGRDEQGAWRLLDDNSASDADLWFAYALLEAGRVWHRDDYTQAAHAILRNVAAQEVEDLPGLGKMLMPGFRGFIKPGLWQLNPSYLPVPLLRRFASVDPAGPWADIARNTATFLKAAAPQGFVADWVSYRENTPGQGAFIVDPVKGDLGSYDAIRVYLWAGITPRKDPLAKPVLDSLGGMLRVVASTGNPPEKVQTQSGSASGNTAFGFSAALLPYLDALGQPALRDGLAQRVREGIAQSLTPDALKAAQPPYYHFVLSLFALGFMDQRYHFTDNGQLHTAWEASCAHIAQ